MTAKGKITAARVAAGDRILVKHYTAENVADLSVLKYLDAEHALGISDTKTGAGVTVARVLKVEAKLVTGGRRDRRVYDIYTSEGLLAYNAPAQTMILAPEDAAGVKRAHVEALAANEAYDRTATLAEEALAKRAAAPAPVEFTAEEEAERAAAGETPIEVDQRHQDEALTLHSQDGKVDSMNNASDTETTPAVPTTEDHTGSTVVRLLEKVWARIRADHPELPEVVIITGSGLVGASKWGHFRAEGWKLREEGAAVRKHELFLAGEALAKGARQVLQTMLHEAAHTLAKVRGQQDTSRQGRWHNATFRKTAEEMGLEHRGTTADKSHGFSFVTLTAATAERYADLLAELDAEIKLVCHLPLWMGGTTDQDEETEGGEKITGKPQSEGGAKSGPLKATCGCEEPLIIRLSQKVMDLGVVRCDKCEELFTAG